MRKTIIFGTLAALFGFAALAQVSDRSPAKAGESTQVTRVAANDSESRHERDKTAERSRERHDGSGDKRHEVREDDDEDKAAAHQDRR